MVEFITNEFKLRPFLPSDAEIFHLAINTQKIALDTTIPLPWSLDSIRWWIGFISDAATRKPLSEIHFVIEIAGQLAGSIGLINIDSHRCEIGYWLKPEYSGQGLMSKIVKIVTEYGAKNHNIKRFFAPILLHNKASARVLEKNGFILEGTLKSYYFKNNQYIDALCYAKV